MIPNPEELIDPRPNDGHRRAFCGMTMLPVTFECDWMKHSEVLRSAVVKQLCVLLGCDYKEVCNV